MLRRLLRRVESIAGPMPEILLRPQRGRLSGRQHCYQNFAMLLYRTSNRHERVSTFKMRDFLALQRERAFAAAAPRHSLKPLLTSRLAGLMRLSKPWERRSKSPFVARLLILARERRAAVQVRLSVARNHELAKRARKNWEARRAVGGDLLLISGSFMADWDFGAKPAPFSRLFGAKSPFRFACERIGFVCPFRNSLKS